MKRAPIHQATAAVCATTLALSTLVLGSTTAQAAPTVVQPTFSYADGWRVERHVRELADVTGDGRVDIVGFGDAGTWIARWSPVGRFMNPAGLEIGDFGYDQGWRNNLNPRALADLNGDGLQDIAGLGYEGMYAAYGRTDSTVDAPFLMSGDYGVGLGWDERLPRLLGDVNGDGRDDVVGFGAGRTVVTLS